MDKLKHLLPIELIQIIVGIASKSDRHTTCSLRLISKEVNRWVTPDLFRTLEVSENTLNLMTRVADESFNLWKNVRNLKLSVINPYDFKFYHMEPAKFSHLDPHAYNSLVRWVLKQCTNIEILLIKDWELGEDLDPHFAILETFPGLREVRMLEPWEVSTPKPITFPYLWNVTHFYYGHSEFCHGVGNMLFHCLPQVTHLAFFVTELEDDVLDTIQHWLTHPSLKMLHVDYQFFGVRFLGTLMFQDRWETLVGIEDRRLFVGFNFKNNFSRMEELTPWNLAIERCRDWRVRVRDPDMTIDEEFLTTHA